MRLRLIAVSRFFNQEIWRIIVGSFIQKRRLIFRRIPNSLHRRNLRKVSVPYHLPLRHLITVLIHLLSLVQNFPRLLLNHSDGFDVFGDSEHLLTWRVNVLHRGFIHFHNTL